MTSGVKRSQSSQGSHKQTMNNIRFNRGGRRQDVRSEQVRQSLEDYRRKIRFKQVKFSIIVLSWQVAILVLR